MTLAWLRLYTEFASDPKIQILAFEDQRHYVMLLCLKGNGTLDASIPSEAYRERLIAKALGLDVASSTEAKRRLMEGGLIGPEWQPLRWESRQYKSDHDAAERKRNQRERDAERDSHNHVTTTSRDSHVLDSDAESETDSEQIQKQTQKQTQRGMQGGEPRAKRSAANRLPKDFEYTPEMETYAMAQGLSQQESRNAFENFRDYWGAAAGQKARKHDWPATWRMWCRNQADRKIQANTPKKTRFAQLTEKLEAQINGDR